MTRRAVALLMGALWLAAVPSANADIVGAGGDAVHIPPPTSVLLHELESDTEIFAFDEVEDLELTDDVAVNITAPGTYVEPADLTPGIIPAGARINSHFVHVDKVGSSNVAVRYSGAITFDRDILGLAILDAELDGSDGVGAPATTYPTGQVFRGFEMTEPFGTPGTQARDDVVLSADRRTIELRFGVSCCLDQLRVITASTTRLVGIDIKPGSDPNAINPGSRGVVPVAILTTDTLDAATVDPSTACLEDDCTEAHGTGHIEDVDGDGDLDLVLHFETQETGIAAGDTEACLTAETLDGEPLRSCDSIVTVDP